MPLASPGAFAFLLAQASALCGSAPLPTTASPTGAAVVQRDEAFVIVSDAEPLQDEDPVPARVRPADLKIGSAVRIDPALLGKALREIGAAR